MSKVSTGKSRVIRILMNRDGMTQDEAAALLDDVLNMVYDGIANGDDAEDIWMDELNLEPDYLMDCLM